MAYTGTAERLCCAARPRRDRQNEADTTTQPVWRAMMSKLRSAGRVSTNTLILIMDIRSGHGPRLSQDALR